MYNTDLPNRAELPSTGKLLRSTALAALIAGGLLVTTVLPAEYGIDPIGIGRVLGLTAMGEIKMSPGAEARAGERAAAVAPALPAVVAPAVQRQETPAPAPIAALVPAAAPATPEPATGRQDTTTVTLKPGQAAEVKLTMSKDSRVRYERTSAGGAGQLRYPRRPSQRPAERLSRLRQGA